MRAALKMGLHVFVANPMAPTLAEARELVACADDYNVGIVVDPPHRYGVTERTLGGWLREGRHGALRAARLSVSSGPGMESATVWESSAAHLSALLPIVGWGIDRVTDIDSHDGALRATLVLRDGRTCAFEVGTEVNGVELRLDFERASVRAIGPHAHDKALELALTPEDFQAVGIADADDPDPAERFPKESFYRLVTQGGRVADDGLEHLQTLAVVDALQRAAASGQSEAISP